MRQLKYNNNIVIQHYINKNKNNLAMASNLLIGLLAKIQ